MENTGIQKANPPQPPFSKVGSESGELVMTGGEVGGLIQPEDALAFFEPPQGVHVAVAAKTRKETRVRYGFKVGQLGLLINPDTGSEVLEMPSIMGMPGAQPGFLGLLNLRSNLVPLFEMRVLFNMEARDEKDETMVLVFDQGKEAVGILIEGSPVALTGLHSLPNIPPLPEKLKNHVPAGHLQDENIWLEFDHAAFFDQIVREYQ
jgi:twitching motility protein PilI